MNFLHSAHPLEWAVLLFVIAFVCLNWREGRR
jgi:hypothetical protein